MNSEQIQDTVYNWACAHGFTAPYGVLTSSQTNRKGAKYRSVTFGYARTRDYEVQIYNRNFMILRDSSQPYGNIVFKSYNDLQIALDAL